MSFLNDARRRVGRTILMNDRVLQLLVQTLPLAAGDDVGSDAAASSSATQVRIERMQVRKRQRATRRALAKQRRAHRLNLRAVGGAHATTARAVKLAAAMRKLRRQNEEQKPKNIGEAAGIETVELEKDEFIAVVEENRRNRHGVVSFFFFSSKVLIINHLVI